MFRRAQSVASFVVALAGRCGSGAGEPRLGLEAVALEGLGEAGRYPQLAVGLRGEVRALWTEELPGSPRRHRLRLASFAGGAFSSPTTVAEGEAWFVNWADVPRVAIGARGELAVTWLEKLGAGTYAYGIRLSQQSHPDDTWTAPAWLHVDRSETEHGFASLAALGEGRFAAVWLDGHATAGAGHGDGHGGHGGGAMTLKTRVFGNGESSSEVELDPRVCDCCPTALVRLDDGGLVVAYRDRGEDELRDISIVRSLSSNTWTEPRALHADGWRIAGCPVNGPALAARGEHVACAWFTMGSDETPRVHVALSTDGARSFGAPLRVDAGNPIGRVALVTFEDGGWLVAWLEQTGPETAEWRARCLGPELELGEPISVGSVPAGRPTGSITLASSGSGNVLALWTDPELDGLRAATLRRR